MDGLSARRTEPGFTLLELMVVVSILGAILLMVPMNMSAWGKRSRLESAGNSIVSAISNARNQAIRDAYETQLEFGQGKTHEGKDFQGYRLKFTNIPRKREGATGQDEQDVRRQNREDRAREREWLYTGWHKLHEDLEFRGFSEARGHWAQLTGDKPYVVRFDAAGNVDHALAIRVESTAIDVPRDQRTITIRVNGLTSAASWQKGEQELSPKRPASDFSY